MKTDHKIVYILGASALAVILASSAIAVKYEDYADYVVWGVFIYAALLFVVTFFLIKRKKAT